MATWILNILRTTGYPGLVALAALECVFPPIPSELILPFAGFLVRDGDLLLGGAVAAAAVGASLGSLPLYALGRRLGPERLKPFVERHCRWAAVTPSEVDRATAWFQRYGGRAVLLAHWCRVCGRSSPFRRGSRRCRSGASRCSPRREPRDGRRRW